MEPDSPNSTYGSSEIQFLNNASYLIFNFYHVLF